MNADDQNRDLTNAPPSTARARSLKGHIDKIEQQIESGSIDAEEGIPLLALLRSELEEEHRSPKLLVQSPQKTTSRDEPRGIAKALMWLYLLGLAAGLIWLGVKGDSWTLSELYQWLSAWSQKKPSQFNFWWVVAWGLGIYAGATWCGAHADNWRASVSYPHPCHFLVALYIALPAVLLAFVATVQVRDILLPNPLLLAAGAWHLVRAFKLFRAWRKNEASDA